MEEAKIIDTISKMEMDTSEAETMDTQEEYFTTTITEGMVTKFNVANRTTQM